MKRFCKCLNVTLNVQKELQKVSGKDLISNASYDAENDSFFGDEVVELELAMAGVEMEQSMLSTKRVCGDWSVNRCENCRIDTHATHSIKGRIVASTKLLAGNDEHSRLMECNEYSKAFRILLPSSDTSTFENSPTSPPLSPRFKGSFESFQNVESILKKYLQRQEADVNERIRLYTEQQHAVLRDVRTQANKDKEKVLSILTRQEDAPITDQLFDTMNDSYFANPLNEQRDHPTELPLFRAPKKSWIVGSTGSNSSSQQSRSNAAHSLPSQVMAMPPAGRSNSKLAENLDFVISNKGSLSKSLGKSGSAFSNQIAASNGSSISKQQAGYNDDTMFNLEGFQDSHNVEPFFESDDESGGEATSLESSGGYAVPNRREYHGSHGDSNRVYATSVPVGIPLRPPQPLSDDEEEKKQSPNEGLPDNIADSIKQLAQSIQDSSYNLFGELPRSRFNTMYSSSHR